MNTYQIAFEPGSEWRRMDDFTRQKVLLKFADLIEGNQEYLASLTRVTLGAPYSPFGKSEIDTAIGCFRCVFPVLFVLWPRAYSQVDRLCGLGWQVCWSEFPSHRWL